MNEESTHASFANKSWSWQFIERPALERAISISEYADEATILDLGCGAGRVVDFHVQRGANTSNIRGIDVEISDLNIAKSRFPAAHFENTRMQDVGLGFETTSIVSAVMALRYLDDEQLSFLLTKVADGLKPGGLFVVLDVHPARYALDDGVEKYFDEGPREVETPWGVTEKYNYRTIATYLTMIAKAGMRIISLDECPIDCTVGEIDPEQYKKYSASPARFLISAMR